MYHYSDGKNNIVGFRKVPELTSACKILLSANANNYGKGYRLITNLNYHGLKEGSANILKLSIMVHSVKNGMIITTELLPQ